MAFRTKFSWIEIVEVTDPMMKKFTGSLNPNSDYYGISFENFFEIHLVYWFGLVRKNTVIGNGKSTVKRDALKAIIQSVGHGTYTPLSSFISMYNRKTFIILDNPEDIKEIYPEEFL